MSHGIEPVENFVIETIFDVNDERLTKFRDTIFEEDLKLDKMHRSMPENDLKNNVKGKIYEDAWKYSDDKWYRVGFDRIDAIIEDGEIVGMSGSRMYGDYMRISMHLYLLKRVRKKYPGIKYLKNGWFDRQLSYGKESNIKGLFFTVYAYSKKLQGLINNHRGKIISLVDKSHLLYINDVHDVGEYMFNRVPQTFFYYKINDEFSIDEILDSNKKNKGNLLC